MLRLQVLSCCALALVTSISVGCAGGGLKNMFGRSDTDGYRTLEEIEADNAQLAEADAATADELPGPRFASWVPFIGERSQDEQLAATDSESPDDASDEAESVSRGWMRNPFRRDSEPELDPFLLEERDTRSAVASSEERPEKDDGTSASSPPRTPTGRDARVSEKDAIAQVSHAKSDSAERSGPSSERGATARERSFDELIADAAQQPADDLADEFEQQFREATLDAVDESETAEQLIVGGARKSSATRSQSSGDDPEQAAISDKLSELERLLAERKSAALQASHSRTSADDLEAQFAESFSPQAAVDRNLARAAAEASKTLHGASAAADSFDRFLDTSAAARKSFEDRTVAGARAAVTKSAEQVASVAVADAESLFGDAVRSVTQRSGETINKAADAIAATDLTPDGMRDAGLDWINSKLDSAEVAAVQKTRQQIESTADAFEAVFAARNGTPEKTAFDNGQSDSADVELATADAQSDAAASLAHTSIQPVSSTRTGAASPGLAGDPFFDAAAQTLANTAPTTPSTAMASGVPQSGGFPFSGRTLLFLIGGIIVVALLFAPDRKKVAPVSSTPAGR